MKRIVKVVVPIILAIAVVLCTAWYLFVYDRAFTRDMLLTFARHTESKGNHSVAAWFYKQAYSQSANSDDVAIELAEQYKTIGNFTKAEYTLTNAISEGGSVDLYIALCKTYIQQDKVLDAVNMLNNVTDPEIKTQLDALRPTAPTASPAPGYYNQYISATISSESGTVYVSTVDKYPSILKDTYKDSISLNDGENTIYAITISDNGLVSPLGIFGYTVGGVVQKMEFHDTSLEAEIRRILGVDENKELYTNDLWTIKELTIPESVKNYEDLVHMPFLESLAIDNGSADEISRISTLGNLSYLKITNTSISQEALKSIGALPLLKDLTLQACRLTSITELCVANSLVALDLSNNAIRDISPLSGMHDLQTLNLQSNAITDLSALSSCNALVTLDVSSNALTSLAPISNLSSLSTLNAGINTISDISGLSKLTQLTVLKLNNNKLTDISGLAGCVSITELDVSTNEIAEISSLTALTNMTNLNFAFNQVAELPAFSKDCALAFINGSNNKISTLKPLSSLLKLNVVDMDYNADISSVDTLESCPLLVEVNVYGTKVKDASKLTSQSVIVNYSPV